MALAGFIAVKTRPYAGWFLISAGAMVVLHALAAPARPPAAGDAAGVRRDHRGLRGRSGHHPGQLEEEPHGAPAVPERQRGPQRCHGAANSNNLALESVDYSTRGKVFANLPQRMLDVVVRPYPWQVANPSQQLGAVGSLFALTVLVLLIGALWRRRGRGARRSRGRLLYPMIFLLAAYALSAGNAGTSFRYRTHLVTLAVAMLVALRARAVPAQQSDLEADTVPAIREPGRPVALVQ